MTLCNVAFENGIVSEDCSKTSFFVIVLLYKGEWERTECINYRGSNLLNVIGKI